MAYHFSVVEIIHEINQQDTLPSPKPHTPEMSITLKQFTNIDPYECILCGNRMIFTHAEAGLRPEELLVKRRYQFQRERWLRQAA